MSYFQLVTMQIIFGVWHLSNTAMAATIEDLNILDQLLRRNYDRRVSSNNYFNTTSPTEVYVELDVRSFGAPSPLTMDYKVDLYLKQKWKDERLKDSKRLQPMDLNDINLVKFIWKPDVYFSNGVMGDFQRVTVPNVLVRINPDGYILYVLRLKMSFSCLMDLSKYPLDIQICSIEVASFANTMSELVLHWEKTNPITTRNLGMSQFEMVNIVASKCHGYFPLDNYACLRAEFYLSRLLGFHILQSYLPTILMVVVSWITFWMDVNSVPGRVTLGITTLLTVSSKSSKNIESSYIKAIDVWLGTCTAFIFMALVEFTIVNYLWRKECKVKKANTAAVFDRAGCKNSGARGAGCPARNKISMINLPMIPVEGINMLEPLAAIKYNKYKNAAKTIDETSRFAFPIAFTIFLVIYWSYYLILV